MTRTPEQIQDIVNKMAETYGKVSPIVINVDDTDQVIGFFREPSYDVLLYTSDCLGNKEMSKGGEALVRYCLIAEESDQRILDKENFPKIAASFVLASFKLFGLHTAQKEIKKN